MRAAYPGLHEAVAEYIDRARYVGFPEIKKKNQ